MMLKTSSLDVFCALNWRGQKTGLKMIESLYLLIIN